MIRPKIRQIALAAFVAPLALGLSGCGSEPATEPAGSGEPIENIAAPEGQSWTEVVSKTDEGGYIMGNPEAPIKLVEFASLTCPHCAQFTADGGEELREQFVASGRVSWEFRNFVMNPLDLTMAMIVRCASPESFFALTEQTLANQDAILERWGTTDEGALTQAINQPADRRYQAIAGVAGLDDFYAARGIAREQTQTCLADASAAEDLVQVTSAQGEEHGITGTPSFLINGQKVDINSWPDIKARLESMGAR